jgi:Mlc titration factor MtfA (ptsG expression regulator)
VVEKSFMNIVIIAVCLALVLFLLRGLRKKKVIAPEIPEQKEHDLLLQHVKFYKALDADGQASFLSRVQQFLAAVTITPVGEVTITDLDRLFVASSAIIPIFAFKDWSYANLDEVLIYPNAFTQDFSGRPEESNVLGMVGDGAMHRMMILSIGSLRSGFEGSSAGNTGIHEFAHLLDKADGATDGVPEAMLPKDLVARWIEYMHKEIQQIKHNHSDIDSYAATNDAEFFAVISEYFFQKPEQLKSHHPELWEMLNTMYSGAIVNK